ncbi:hypothetical protein BDN67DRAFT_904778, partial [Paxillus ammoniavirescens]
RALIATMREMGCCPCPRCLVSKDRIDCVGTLSDLLREAILKKARAVDGSFTERMLGNKSWVPTINAFVSKISAFGLDPFVMLVVDFMHECELGTWKSLFSHLIRLLMLSRAAVVPANSSPRFRQIPSFGRGTIRKFSRNTSEMKWLVARDFEDILQCAIPVFEGLFPPDHDRIVSTLLFHFAEWHALAKMRLHTEATLKHLESAYASLCRKLRLFCKKTCAKYHTVELPKEKTARLRRQGQVPADSNAPSRTSADLGELAHRALKACYPLINKKDMIRQLSKHEQRWRRLQCIAEHQSQTTESSGCRTVNLPKENATRSPRHVLSSRKFKLCLYPPLPLLLSFQTQDFLPNLRNHLLHRLLGVPLADQDQEYSSEERNKVLIRNDTLYALKTMRVRYTTYDLRDKYDFIHLDHQCDIMVPTGESGPGCHPYWYARVLGIYHTDVRLLDGDEDYRNIHLLWVRWFGTCPGHRSGLKAGWLPKIGFVPCSDTAPFGFLDPTLVIRAAHLIPAFADGRGCHLLPAGRSAGRRRDEEDDWVSFYINT